mmetsp:Transcript_14026/g.24807  ORF Transcript_14026/g.24807 Transcript_14026/m.24807 type:complete len:84 (+) Transcript_14026:334-585(+)
MPENYSTLLIKAIRHLIDDDGIGSTINQWNITQQSNTVGVAKVTSIQRNCSNELPEFGDIYNESEVCHRVVVGGWHCKMSKCR